MMSTMSVGAGIAIAGIWMLPVACAFSKQITNAGWFISIFVAFIATYVVMH